MALSMLIALAAAPALLGTQEAVRQGQAKEKREEHRARRCNLTVDCVRPSRHSDLLNGRLVVLKGGKLYIDTSTDEEDPTYGCHPFAGYYLPYPDTKYEGVVTTIDERVPMLNWVYIEKDTYSVRYGVRADAQPNLTGPWDCTRQDRRMTFEGWEGFVAVEEEKDLWAVRFDRDDDGLRSRVTGKRVLEIELTRREKRWKQDPEARQADQSTAHSSDESSSAANESTSSATTQSDVKGDVSEECGKPMAAMSISKSSDCPENREELHSPENHSPSSTSVTNHEKR